MPSPLYPNSGVLNQITDKLTYQNPETLEIEPWIAESWEVSPDFTQYTFRIRPDVTFSDGTALDAAAVAANFDSFGLGDPDLNFRPSEVVNKYDRSEVIDPLTVRLHFKAPSPGFLQGTTVTRPRSSGRDPSWRSAIPAGANWCSRRARTTLGVPRPSPTRAGRISTRSGS